MNITTKYETGGIVYAVHPCRLICSGQAMAGGETHCGAGSGDPHAEDIYIVCPHEVRGVTACCGKKSGTEILYELSGGDVRTEQDLFSSFEDAVSHAAGLYADMDSRDSGSAGYGKTEILREAVCGKLQQVLRSVLSSEQLERFGEEFFKATQGLVFSEA